MYVKRLIFFAFEAAQNLQHMLKSQEIYSLIQLHIYWYQLKTNW